MRLSRTIGRPLLIMTVMTAFALAGPVAGQLEEFEVFIEINDTDGDAGIQLFFDGEGWDRVRVKGPGGVMLLNIQGHDGIALQGLTEGFFESAEPSFDEQPLSEFLGLFPAGRYKVAARNNETGDWSRLTTMLTHDLPGAPVIVVPAEDEVVDPEELDVEWLPVADPPGSEIVGYQVIVETDDDDAPLRVFSADVDAETFQIEVPEEFLTEGDDYKAEVIVIETSGNKTISEVEFSTEGDGEDDEDDEDDDDDDEDDDDDDDDDEDEDDDE